jgi:hypothetical protein
MQIPAVTVLSTFFGGRLVFVHEGAAWRETVAP